MFVQPSPPALDQADHPAPRQDRAARSGVAPSQTAHLLILVRKLIDFGVLLANTLKQGASAATLAHVTRYYGIPDVALIIARITRGLQIAAALEARLISGASPAQLRPAPVRFPSARPPRTAMPGEQDTSEPERRRASGADARLDRLMSAEAIAADVRRRPVGAVLADICRDLGIMPCHPLWWEVTDAILGNGGNCATLIIERLKRDEFTCDDFGLPAVPAGNAGTVDGGDISAMAAAGVGVAGGIAPGAGRGAAFAPLGAQHSPPASGAGPP